jgi:hypothetical protein
VSPLEQHERLEIETLDLLRRERLLDPLVLGGGTMMRLCHSLPRFSVDLDWYVVGGDSDFGPRFRRMAQAVERFGGDVTDCQEKRRTWLIEFRHALSPRRLKIEIRKDPVRAASCEPGIAFSRSAPTLQVQLTVCTLAQMWRNKVEALLDRGLFRDAYDLEFLLRRGAGSPATLGVSTCDRMLEVIGAFRPRDIRAQLGAVLPPDERRRVATAGFSLLEGALRQVLSDANATSLGSPLPTRRRRS